MAKPLTADQFVAALKNAGVRVVEHGNWRNHNRNHKGAWGPVHGVMVHHTGSYSTEVGMVDLCRTGYSSLPGPLCHGVIDRSGTVHLVGYGRCNHAGLGDDDVLRAVIAEKQLPVDNEANTDGNARFYGFEAINTGVGQSWPRAQVDAMKTVSAAICRAHGWTARSVIAHKEWQPGKPDPFGIGMDDFRDDVAALLGRPPASGEPPRHSVRLSHIVAAARKDPPAAQGHTTHRSEVLVIERALVAEGLLAERWADGSFGTKTVVAYARWQRSKAGGSYSGRDADGIPGRDSLSRLGRRHGFTVTA